MERKLIVEEWLSLDGYVCDREGRLDFFAKHVRESYTTEQRLVLLRSIDTILFGRNTYTQFSALWPERPVENDLLAEKINTLNKIVFSRTLQRAAWGRRAEAVVDSGDPAEKIRALKQQAGKNIVLWGSITLAQSLMQENLVDEYHLHLCPVLTGGGRTLFTGLQQQRELLFLSATPLANGVLLLKYSKNQDKEN